MEGKEFMKEVFRIEYGRTRTHRVDVVRQIFLHCVDDHLKKRVRVRACVRQVATPRGFVPPLLTKRCWDW